jgi:hypothetical protein
VISFSFHFFPFGLFGFGPCVSFTGVVAANFFLLLSSWRRKCKRHREKKTGPSVILFALFGSPSVDFVSCFSLIDSRLHQLVWRQVVWPDALWCFGTTLTHYIPQQTQLENKTKNDECAWAIFA